MPQNHAPAAVQTAQPHRVRSDRGQPLDISLTHCVARCMNPRLAAPYDARCDAARRARRAVQRRPACGTFRCREGRALTVAALEDHFWRARVAALPLPAFVTQALG
jgi:crotonobetainyl-CoA:carnitine CoA-transferase CaiB-like acyl-CoA transferase